MQMQLGSEAQIPDGLLAANALLGENSRQGVPTSTHALYQGFGFVISNTALDLKRSLYDEGVWSRYTAKERDQESGLDYFGARYYTSNMGLFSSPDVCVVAQPDNGPGLIMLGMAWGHHFVDRAIVAEQNAQNSLAGKFFFKWRTGGPLKPGGVHTGFPKAAELSQNQVRKIVDDIVNRSGKTMSEWGEKEINEAVEEVRNTGGDTGKFLQDIAAENPTVRTVSADTQDIMTAAKSAMDTVKANAGAAAASAEEGAEEVVQECASGECPIP